MIIDIILGGALGSLIGVILKRFVKFNKISAFVTAASIWLILLFLLTFLNLVEENPNVLVSAVALSLYACIYKNEFTSKYDEKDNKRRLKCIRCNKEITNFEDVVICDNCKHIYHIKCLPELKYCPECTSQKFKRLKKIEKEI